MQNADGVILQYISKIQYIAKWRKIIVIVPLSPQGDKTRQEASEMMPLVFLLLLASLFGEWQ